MKNRSDVFTTTQAAQICKLSPALIQKNFDSGNLKGFLVPGSRHRRFSRKDLLRFMEDYDIPTDGMPKDPVSKLHILAGEEIRTAIEQLLSKQSDAMEVQPYNSSWELGIAVDTLEGTLVIDSRHVPPNAMEAINTYLEKTGSDIRSIAVVSQHHNGNTGNFDEQIRKRNHAKTTQKTL